MSGVTAAADYRFSRKNQPKPTCDPGNKNMDWEFKPSSSWDLTELDIDDFDVLGKNQNMEVFSLDSGSGVLGGDGIMSKLSGQKHSTRSSFSASSSKKPRLQGSGQLVSCLVDGCTADLTGCRDYHRRHRVCETHSKTPVVTIRGKEQRFCQQCSRFHSLGEFDEVKRSCRKRLDGHNRRRRKPRAESMYLNYGSFLTNHQGTKLLRFGGSPAYTTTFDGWRENEKPNQKLHVTVEQSTQSNSYACFCNARERKFPFLLGDDEKVNQPLYEASFQQFVNPNASSSLSSAAELVVEPKSALSLLSKHTIHHHASALASGPTNLVQFNFNGSVNQHSGQHLPFRNVTGPDNNQLIGMIHFRTEGLLENEAAQVLSFSWE